jgi:hypothetical protein
VYVGQNYHTNIQNGFRKRVDVVVASLAALCRHVAEVSDIQLQIQLKLDIQLTDKLTY